MPLVRVVEQAAIAAARTRGNGDRKESDRVATEAMRQAFEEVPIDGTIVIGEGERDQAPMLYIGEKVGEGASGTGAYREMVEQIKGRIEERGEITVADVRDMFGASRKYALALLDHLDQQRVTRRVGDARGLR